MKKRHQLIPECDKAIQNQKLHIDWLTKSTSQQGPIESRKAQILKTHNL